MIQIYGFWMFFNFFFLFYPLKELFYKTKIQLYVKKKKNVLDKNEITKKLFHN